MNQLHHDKRKFIRSIFICVVVSCAFVQCKTDKKSQIEEDQKTVKSKFMTIQQRKFGGTINGIDIDSYSLRNAQGIEVDIITYGGIITSIKAPDKNGDIENVVLGFETLDEYVESSPYFGALVGRYGNRIANGKFSLNGKEYSLAMNNGPNNLHGGLIGFDKVVWKASTRVEEEVVSLILDYTSKDMEEGFPGNLNTRVTYSLDSQNELSILYEATTDKETIVNLTNHSYFNLSGNIENKILDHELTIAADRYLPVNEFMIPTGELITVKDTPFDFTASKKIGRDIEIDHEQLNLGLGFDHCWVLNNQDQGVRLIATANHPGSGRQLDVYSDEPGVQLYTGNHLEGTHQMRSGFCLETQHYPDSPNQKKFPSVVLSPGEKYSSQTSYKFSVK